MAINLGSTQRSFLTFTLEDDSNSTDSSRASHRNSSETSEIDNTIVLTTTNYNLSNSIFTSAEYAALLTGVLGPNEKININFESVNKLALCKNLTVEFSTIKALTIHNRETTYGNDINIHATGTDGLTGIFNGESGNFLIKPYGIFNYANTFTGTILNSLNRTITLEDVGGNGAEYRLIVVGNTGEPRYGLGSTFSFSIENHTGIEVLGNIQMENESG